MEIVAAKVSSSRLKRITTIAARVFGWMIVAIALLSSITLGYGITSSDVKRLEDFVEATNRWVSNQDFRQVCREYIHYSHEAMTIRIVGVPAGWCIMVLRSAPGLPDWLSVNETSQRHYDNFARGELSAYLHLSGEQGTDLYIGQFESMARQETLSDEQIRQFLESFHLSAPVSHDAAAIESVRKLLRDTDAARSFEICGKTDAKLLQPYIATLARSYGLPAVPFNLSPGRQQRVLAALDDHIARENPPLWRTKQVNDFLSGVWGQAYAQIYRDYAIGPLLTLHRIGRWTTWVFTAVLIYAVWRKRSQLRVSRASGVITSNP